jgi:peptidoglycan/xylan/chitin deacetylase (PgdA/CDA1 family)
MPVAAPRTDEADDRLHDGRLVISLDFELHWGVRDRRSTASYGANLRGVWDVVPRMLELFEQRGIRATWATVGFLMAQDRDELLEHVPRIRPHYVDPRLDPYCELVSIGSDERDDPYHFASSLVGAIIEAPGQELATHTFSHYYAMEPNIAPDALAADLEAALALAARRGVAITSIVFPRNQVSRAALRVCRELGLTAFRGTEHARYQAPRAGTDASRRVRAARMVDTYVPLGTHHVARPSLVEGMVNVPASRFLRPWRGTVAMLEPLRVARILTAMSSAARGGAVFHLWWHPHNFGVHQDENLRVLDRILGHYDRLRETHGYRSATMHDVAEEHRARIGT